MSDSAVRPFVDALIFAGGTGARMTGSEVPKQFLRFGGRALILYTLDKFEENPGIDAVTVVCLESWMDGLKAMLEREGYDTPMRVISGGDTGQRSRLNGINSIRNAHPGDEKAIVLVHDGVRPLVDGNAITACISSVVNRGCTAVTAPAIETVVLVDDEGRVTGLENRSQCRLARAPQGFRTEELWRCCNRAEGEGLDFIDSVSLMAHYGYEIYTVDGPPENIKVTTPADYFTFKGLMDMRDLSQLWGGSEGDSRW